MQGAAIIATTRTTGAVPGADAGDMNALLADVARSGDRESFGRLFAYFAPRLKAYLVRIGASADLAEDLAQDVMMKVWRKARQFDPAKASAATWIYTIARNQRIDAFRRLHRPDFDPDDPGLMPEEEPRADDMLDRRGRDARIRAAFEKLPPNQREVVRLHFIEDEPHSAIAQLLGLPLGTVKSRLRLAFDKIRNELGDPL